jgi:hypothetical protein
MASDLTGDGRDLRPLEGDRRAFRVVLVVGF